MNRIILWLLAIACSLATSTLWAHEIRPAYLQIEETAPATYDVLWKVPSRGDRVIDITPRFDASLELSDARETLLDGFVLYHYRLKGGGNSDGLPGTRLTIDRLPSTTIDVLVNIRLLEGGEYSFLLQPSENTVSIPREPDKLGVLTTYTGLGIEHILGGIDHLLFVLALIILTRGFGTIVKTVTAFTLAHSITLGLSTLGFIKVPGPPVEATIALSILFLALEILRGINGNPTLTGRKPWLVAFIFGLLHGFGFAGALAEIGLPQAEIPLALAAFNVGVEAGQLAFVAVVLLLIAALHQVREWSLAAQKIPPYAIGAISAFWVIERIWAF
ncbi:HupE/UreJ family protein [Microbulbifer hydrolyticus]|uniref:HupE/UreJ family protein n=1 Tax=Microbulbifer hydrolyticus TaxID=48074 RepID=A0A6P1T9B5_9GAMM|nr:HupE/UreJ family protein [Microbulbifer hydrolyticus]MBB5210964.1 hydrogenase/urease accessory protein HupE [Microbulbifer hydrolyticus]QHQ38223.1 HupE/UreJ family protein [Microbulbifer hydrolyticus]